MFISFFDHTSKGIFVTLKSILQKKCRSKPGCHSFCLQFASELSFKGLEEELNSLIQNKIKLYVFSIIKCMPETSAQNKLQCRLCSLNQSRGIFAVDFWACMFIYLLFCELSLLEFALTEILTHSQENQNWKIGVREVRNSRSSFWQTAHFSLM